MWKIFRFKRVWLSTGIIVGAILASVVWVFFMGDTFDSQIEHERSRFKKQFKETIEPISTLDEHLVIRTEREINFREDTDFHLDFYPNCLPLVVNNVLVLAGENIVAGYDKSSFNCIWRKECSQTVHRILLANDSKDNSIFVFLQGGEVLSLQGATGVENWSKKVMAEFSLRQNYLIPQNFVFEGDFLRQINLALIPTPNYLVLMAVDDGEIVAVLESTLPIRFISFYDEKSKAFYLVKGNNVISRVNVEFGAKKV